MKKLLAALLLVASVMPAFSQEPSLPRVGQEFEIHGPDMGLVRHGCFNLEVAKDIQRTASYGSKGAAIIEIMKREQLIENQDWSAACTRLPAQSSTGRFEKYRVQKVYDWPGGGPTMFCLEIVFTYNVGPVSDKPSTPACWWTSLAMNPILPAQ